MFAIYWAWLQRDCPVNSRTIGFWTAIVGALAGVWLAFNTTAGILAIVTTVVGAALGANLTLIVLDIARGLAVQDRVTAASAEQTLEPRPSSA